MHSLTICFGPTGTVWTLLFKEEEKARTAYVALDKPTNTANFFENVFLNDDYGQELQIRLGEIKGVLLEDMDLSQLAQVERGLHQARSQAKAQTRAMQDPVIKESLRAQQQGPAVMSPMGNRFNG